MFLPAQLIQKKRDGAALTEAEIRFFIHGFTCGDLPDYQMAALAMAVCLPLWQIQSAGSTRCSGLMNVSGMCYEKRC